MDARIRWLETDLAANVLGAVAGGLAGWFLTRPRPDDKAIGVAVGALLGWLLEARFGLVGAGLQLVGLRSGPMDPDWHLIPGEDVPAPGELPDPHERFEELERQDEAAGAGQVGENGTIEIESVYRPECDPESPLFEPEWAWACE